MTLAEITSDTAPTAASRIGDQFIALVADLVGAAKADRCGALVLSSAHGIASLELSGELAHEKWKVRDNQLVHVLVASVQAGAAVE